MNDVQKFILNRAMQKTANALTVVKAGLPMVPGTEKTLRPALKALLALLGVGAAGGTAYGVSEAIKSNSRKQQEQIDAARDLEVEAIGNIVNDNGVADAPEVGATTLNTNGVRAAAAAAGTGVGALGGLGVNKLLGNTSTKSKIISALLGATTLGTAGAFAPEIKEYAKNKFNA